MRRMSSDTLLLNPGEMESRLELEKSFPTEMSQPCQKAQGIHWFIRSAWILFILGLAGWGVLCLPAPLSILGQVVLGLAFVHMLALQQAIVPDETQEKKGVSEALRFFLGMPVLAISNFLQKHQVSPELPVLLRGKKLKRFVLSKMLSLGLVWVLFVGVSLYFHFFRYILDMWLIPWGLVALPVCVLIDL
ncbi:MAG: hypothetical protein HY939_08245 [Gammaproteobacteria bacterium]|nr:hypothetical protein [Gammaproteobacteria bacterium]